VEVKRPRDFSPYVGPVVDLVNPYITIGRSNGPILEADHAVLMHWADRNPGRWALVGQGEMGLSPDAVLSLGLERSTRNKGRDTQLVYARRAHPYGEDLSDALRRTAKPDYELPELTRSSFNWTPEELAEATEVALANLFPVAEGVGRGPAVSKGRP
jgi:hypothetical protein